MNLGTSHPFTADFLDKKGLVLIGILDVADLQDISDLFPKEISLTHFKRLILIGNGGGKIWNPVSDLPAGTINPIDTFSLQSLETICREYLPQAKNEILYPSKHIIPLQRLGMKLGWGHPSPLGININDKYGLWWAFRGAVLTSAEIEPSAVSTSPSPCHSCSEKPCITHCPGQAVSMEKTLDIRACFHHRATPKSSCAAQCPSRRACPIGQHHQYPRDMTNYIYNNSMRIVDTYIKQDAGQDDLQPL